jgi:hypothetical protein
MGQVKLGAEAGRGAEETGIDLFRMLAKKQRRNLVRKVVAKAQKV